MTVLSAQTIRELGILDPCEDRTTDGGLTYGLGPAGYDLRLDLGEETLSRMALRDRILDANRTANYYVLRSGEFLLAAAREKFRMPRDIMGIVHDKSSLARRGLSVFNTVIEPGWRGYLTLELVNHSNKAIWLTQGQAIAQVVFHRMDKPTMFPYNGKYQDQEAGPQPAR